MTDLTRADDDHVLMHRICGEFLEMPCLRLTCRQAQRLFGLPEHTCRRLLEDLVAHRFLASSVDGTYARASSGPAHAGFDRGDRPAAHIEASA